jgi:hypothetical protein
MQVGDKVSKQTAVEWLEKEFNKLEATVGVYGIMYSLIDQAKAMEKKQIIDACNLQRNDYKGMPTYNKSGEQYYNETYGK